MNSQCEEGGRDGINIWYMGIINKNSIKAFDLLGGNENLFKFWLEIQRTEPSLIRLFDLFLTNAGEVTCISRFVRF